VTVTLTALRGEIERRLEVQAGRACLVCAVFLFALLTVSAGYGKQGKIRLLEISGPVNPVTAEYIGRNIRESARSGDRLVLIEMDTPGGLESSMRQIVKDILSGTVPVAVHVAPSGARAASAGALIALAADFCVMAPGTNIGAAHPVTIGEQPDKVMQEKMLNDLTAYVEGIAARRGRNVETAGKMVRNSLSLSADKALEARVIDFIAADQSELLRKLDGKYVRRGESVSVLRLADAPVERHDMSTREKILDTISNPNIAYLLMMLGFLGLFFELSNPGVILPGVIGGISLILAFFAFQTLPVNYAGVLLILLGLVCFIAEIKIVSHGMLAVGGVVSMILGSLLLFESPEPFFRVSWSVILTTVLLVAGFALFVIRKAVSAHRRKPSSGREGLIGERGVADSDITPEGKVFVRGEYWEAWSDEAIIRGEKIIVIGLEGMRVKVQRWQEGRTILPGEADHG
jgi:membrane-bound serine protease (ClpP class)